MSNGTVSTKIYDNRDDFDFDMVDFPFLDGDVIRRTSYAAYIYQLICFARSSSHVNDFNCRRQGYRYHKVRKTFSKNNRRHSGLVEKYNVSLRKLLQQGTSEPELYGDVVYRIRKKNVERSYFAEQFKTLINRYKRIGYRPYIMLQTSCLVVSSITVDSYASLFNCTSDVTQTQ